MNGDYLYEALGGIAPVYVDEAEKMRFPKSPGRQLASLAACLVLVCALYGGLTVLLTGEAPIPASLGTGVPVTEQILAWLSPTEDTGSFLRSSSWMVIGCITLGLCFWLAMILMVFRPSPSLLRLLNKHALGPTAFWISFGVQLLLFVLPVGCAGIFDNRRERVEILLSLVLWQNLLLLLVGRRIPEEKRTWTIGLGHAAADLVSCPVLLWWFPFAETVEAMAVLYGVSLTMTALYLAWGKWRRWPVAERILRLVTVFFVTVLVQELLFLPGMALLALRGYWFSVGSEAGAAMALLTHVVTVPLLILYWKKTPKGKRSWGIPLGIAASLRGWRNLFSAAVDRLARSHPLPYEIDEAQTVFLVYYLLLMVFITAVLVASDQWEYRKQRRMKRQTEGKGRSLWWAGIRAGLRAPLVRILAVVSVAVLVLNLALSGPDIQLEKGEFLMLESDAPVFFAVAFGVVTLAFVLFLMVLYRKRKDRPGLGCFLLQWAFTLIAFHFLMTGLTLRPGDVGGMYTETVSLRVGLAGLSWAVSILFLALGLKRLLHRED